MGRFTDLRHHIVPDRSCCWRRLICKHVNGQHVVNFKQVSEKLSNQHCADWQSIAIHLIKPLPEHSIHSHGWMFLGRIQGDPLPLEFMLHQDCWSQIRGTVLFVLIKAPSQRDSSQPSPLCTTSSGHISGIVTACGTTAILYSVRFLEFLC